MYIRAKDIFTAHVFRYFIFFLQGWRRKYNNNARAVGLRWCDEKSIFFFVDAGMCLSGLINKNWYKIDIKVLQGHNLQVMRYVYIYRESN